MIKPGQFTVGETFVGAGGTHVGFKEAGFKTLFVNDINKDCIKTLLFNNPELKSSSIYQCSILDLNGKKIKYDIKNKSLDVLFGGIVCKGFSLAGEKSPNDERNFFYRKQIQLVKDLKPKISIIDNLGLEANSRIGKPEQQVLTQMKSLFDVEFVKDNASELPENTKVLMLINPKYYPDETLFMIEQWVLKGGSTLIFLDPYAETEVSINPGMPPLNPRSDLKKLLDTWGINFNNKKSIADKKYALRTVRNIKGREVEVSNYPWIQVTDEGLNQNDGVLAQLSNIIFTNAGGLSTKDGTKFDPLITSSELSGLVDSDKAGDSKSDPRDLIKDLKIYISLTLMAL